MMYGLWAIAALIGISIPGALTSHIHCAGAGVYPNAYSPAHSLDMGSSITCAPGWLIDSTGATGETIGCSTDTSNSYWDLPLPLGCIWDIDECEDDPDLCGTLGYCMNTPGSYTCSCPDNYAWIGPLTVITEAGITAQGECLQVNCGPPSGFTNTEYIGYSEVQSVGSDVPATNPVTVTCRDGFEAAAGVVTFDISCLGPVGGPLVWTPVDATLAACVDKDECTVVPGICGANGRCGNYPGWYQCTCEPGYQWTDVAADAALPTVAGATKCLSVAVPIVCGSSPIDPALVLTAAPNDPPLEHDAIEYQCLEGFQASYGRKGSSPEDKRKFDLYCVGGDIYRASLPMCEPVPCEESGQDHHAHHDPSSAISSAQGSIVRYECDAGYHVSPGLHHYVKTCQTDATWTQAGPCVDINECETTPCPVTAKCRNTQGSYHCECSEGYIWNDASSDCLPTKCGEPPFEDSRMEAHLTGGESPAAGYLYKSMVTYTCLPGYRPVYFPEDNTGSKDFTFTCTAEGEWETLGKPRCARISCGHPPDKDNAFISASMFLYGDTVTYHCRSGWEASTGGLTITCGTSAQWSTTGQCIDVNECAAGDICGGIKHKCYNLPGSYKCVCAFGFKMDGSGACIEVLQSELEALAAAMNLASLGCAFFETIGFCGTSPCEVSASGRPYCACAAGRSGPFCEARDNLPLILAGVALAIASILAIVAIVNCIYSFRAPQKAPEYGDNESPRKVLPRIPFRNWYPSQYTGSRPMAYS